MQPTPTQRAYAALHEDYTNGLMSRQEYEAECARLGGQSPRRPGSWRRWAAWVVAIVLPLALALIYAASLH